MDWTRQGGAVIASLDLVDGSAAKIVLIAPRSSPKGAVLVLSCNGGPDKPTPLSQVLGKVSPRQATEILCMQERLFGDSGLEPPQVE